MCLWLAASCQPWGKEVVKPTCVTASEAHSTADNSPPHSAASLLLPFCDIAPPAVRFASGTIVSVPSSFDEELAIAEPFAKSRRRELLAGRHSQSSCLRPLSSTRSSSGTPKSDGLIDARRRRSSQILKPSVFAAGT